MLALALFAGQAEALGVTPSRVVLRFEPDYLYERQVCFNTHSISHLKIEVVDELKAYITIDKDELFVDGDVGCINYKLQMPHSFSRPGRHTAGINAVEVAGDDAGGAVFAVVKVQHQIWLEVPYPGKYLELKQFVAENMAAGAVIPFTIDAENKGTDTINSAQGTILIYDKDNQLIGSVKTNTVSNIEPAKVKRFTAEWNSTIYRQGNYRAYLELSYDGALTNESAQFKLGGLDVSLLDYTKEVVIGGIKEFNIVASSLWSEDIPDLKADVIVYDMVNGTKTEVGKFETLTKNLKAWGEETIKGYIDTTPLAINKTYDVKIKLSFAGLSKDYDGKVRIVEPPKPAEKPVEKTGGALFGFLSAKTMIIILIVLLVVMTIVLISALLPKKQQ